MVPGRINRFHLPLTTNDTEGQTLGCRHSNSDVCAKNGMEKVCAFVRPDGLCVAPPLSWAKQFRKLKAASEVVGDAAT